MTPTIEEILEWIEERVEREQETIREHKSHLRSMAVGSLDALCELREFLQGEDE